LEGDSGRGGEDGGGTIIEPEASGTGKNWQGSRRVLRSAVVSEKGRELDGR